MATKKDKAIDKLKSALASARKRAGSKRQDWTTGLAASLGGVAAGMALDRVQSGRVEDAQQPGSDVTPADAPSTLYPAGLAVAAAAFVAMGKGSSMAKAAALGAAGTAAYQAARTMTDRGRAGIVAQSVAEGGPATTAPAATSGVPYPVMRAQYETGQRSIAPMSPYVIAPAAAGALVAGPAAVPMGALVAGDATFGAAAEAAEPVDAYYSGF